VAFLAELPAFPLSGKSPSGGKWGTDFQDFKDQQFLFITALPEH
jgi:hypothetical protein